MWSVPKILVIHGYFMDHLPEDFPMEINHPAIGVSAAGSSLALLLPHLGVQGVTKSST